MTGPPAAAAFTRHGGRLRAARSAFPHAQTPWIDLSTGVNPWPYAAPPPPHEALARLPDPDDLLRLEALAAAAFGVRDASRVVATAGAEAGLRLLPWLRPASRVAIAGPTYDGHAQAWRAAGASVTAWPAEGADVVMIVNPNNPDGRTWAPQALVDLADRQERDGGLLIVDESFVEVRPELSVASVAHPALAVLRSFGKTYGLPGVRLGFVVAPEALASRLRGVLGDWPVSAAALAAGSAAYADAAWLPRMRARLRRAAAALDRDLSAAGFEIAGGTDLFRLVRHPDAARRFTALCSLGVLSRPFDHAPDLLRFGLPHGRRRARAALALSRL